MDNITTTTTEKTVQVPELLVRTIIHSTSGSSIKIHTYGATVFSYSTTSNNNNNNNNNTNTNTNTNTTRTTREQLFLSKHAIIDGTKPIRGGIPIVFPIFGPPSQSPSQSQSQQQSQLQQNTMPQHGFARRSIWTIITVYDTIDYAGILLELDCRHINTNNNNTIIPMDAIGNNNDWYNGLYNNCILRYTVQFNNQYMTNTLSIYNNDTTISIPFQSLLHTYYRIDNNLAMNNTICYVKNLLTNYTLVEDKVNASSISAEKEEQEDDEDNVLTFSSEVDRVYSPKKTTGITKDDDTNTSTVLTIGVGKDTTINVQCSGTISPIINSDEVQTQEKEQKQQKQQEVSYVVWNPYIEKAKSMSDFDNNEYNDMICIEPGLLYSSSNSTNNGNNDSTNVTTSTTSTASSTKSMILLPPNHVATLTQTMCLK